MADVGDKGGTADGAGADAIAVATTEEVLLAECRLIWPNRPPPRNLADYHRTAQQNDQAALCLSGGGIRSAAFSLGVIQALSRKGLLTGFHYLSTVSGGGYIASWLQRWIHELGGDAAEVMHRLAGASERLEAGDEISSPGPGPEPPEVSALRENFGSGSTGLGGPDLWVRSMKGLRNIIANWMLFAPILLLVAMLPLLLELLVGYGSVFVRSREPVLYGLNGIATLALTIASYWTIRAVPSYRLGGATMSLGDSRLAARIVAPLIFWAVAATFAVSADLLPSFRSQSGLAALVFFVAGPRIGPAALLAASTSCGMLVGFLVAGGTLPAACRRAFLRDSPFWVLTSLFVPFVVILGIALFPDAPGPRKTALLVIFGPVWLLWSQLLAQIVFVALRGANGDGSAPEADREWFAHISAILFRPILLWGCAAFATLLLLPFLIEYLRGSELPLPGLLAVITGAVAAFGGTRSAAFGSESLLRFLPLSAIVALATFLFFIALLMTFGPVEQAAAYGIGSVLGPVAVDLASRINDILGTHLTEKWLDLEAVGHIVIGVLAVSLLFLLNKRIPVNRFSLIMVHRNRLARLVLGGARHDRSPDPFTGFDAADDVRLCLLRPTSDGSAILYPIINCAMNVAIETRRGVSGRAPRPFIFSPHSSGSAFLSREGEEGEEGAAGAFVDTSSYGDEPEAEMAGSGISLATAMAISGAAADRQTGYHESALTSLLLALFGARLGVWMPNPARAATLGARMTRSGPDSSLRALLRELGGRTGQDSLDIYLSDGGHFENLGLYEMIRRRCKFIVVVDASADPSATMEDLGNAVRKVKVDLGADIDFRRMRISSRDKPIDRQVAWAYGDIEYGDGDCGRILYIKPSYFETDLPVDLVSYAAASSSFPHESSGDQSFSEAQFESYRTLGYTFASWIGGDEDFDSIKDFFAGVDASAWHDGEGRT
jgi:hypothetical protein